MIDTFDFRAYGLPSLIVSSPVVALLQVIASELGAAAQWWQVVPVPLWLAVCTLSVHLGHNPGKNLEPTLWASWGGPPTTSLLRWVNAGNPERVADLHRTLALLIGSTLRLPSESEERADPRRADQIYETAVGRIIALTRDAGNYPLLKNTLVWYCFRRSLLGLRPKGIIIGVAATLACAILGVLAACSVVDIGVAGPFVAAGIGCVQVLVLVGFASEDSVRAAADRYAQELVKLTYAL